MPIGICPEIEATFEHAGKGVMSPYHFKPKCVAKVFWAHNHPAHCRDLEMDRVCDLQSLLWKHSWFLSWSECSQLSLSFSEMPIGICPEIEATFEHAGKGVIYIFPIFINGPLLVGFAWGYSLTPMIMELWDPTWIAGFSGAHFEGFLCQ